MFPTTIGAKLQVKSNADTDPELEAQIKVTSLDMGLPDIEVDPTSVVFAEVASFDVARAQVTVTNVGARDLLLIRLISLGHNLLFPRQPSKQETLDLPTILGLTVVGPRALGMRVPRLPLRLLVASVPTGAALQKVVQRVRRTTTLMRVPLSLAYRKIHLSVSLTSVPQAWPLPAGQSLTLDLAFSPEVAAAFSGELHTFGPTILMRRLSWYLSADKVLRALLRSLNLDPEDIDGLGAFGYDQTRWNQQLRPNRGWYHQRI